MNRRVLIEADEYSWCGERGWEVAGRMKPPPQGGPYSRKTGGTEGGVAQAERWPVPGKRANGLLVSQ